MMMMKIIITCVYITSVVGCCSWERSCWAWSTAEWHQDIGLEVVQHCHGCHRFI